MDKSIRPNLRSESVAIPASLSTPIYQKTLKDIAANTTLLTQPPKPSRIVPHSHFNQPILPTTDSPAGYSRMWGDAPLPTKIDAIHQILKESHDLSIVDQAILLSIARHESGFNPSAASPQSSAAGIFQIIDSTAQALGLKKGEVFKLDKNITAGIRLYRQNLAFVPTRLTGVHKAAYMYKLHHDGPQKNYGGLEIGYKQIGPHFKKYLEINPARVIDKKS